MPGPLPLILASASPRRVELLSEAGFDFEVRIPDVDEDDDPSLTCEALTLENARRKAQFISMREKQALIIAADTLVYLDEIPFGKPYDLSHAAAMLRTLSGRTHTVCTGVALLCVEKNINHSFAVRSEVTFKTLNDNIIREYHSRIQPLDKAGAYAVQDESAMIIESVVGSWSNVKGLPMERLTEELAQLLNPAS